MPIRLVAAALMLSLGGATRLTGAGSTEVSKKAPAEVLVENTRIVLAAIVKAAAVNHRLPKRNAGDASDPFRRIGDDLTLYYIRAGATAARRLPAEQAAPACLLALGIALDDSPLLRHNVLTRTLWRKVETDDERLQRLRVLGEPTLYGRHDLAQHFSVSAALTATAGAGAAESAGILKEMLDSRDGGSGFSFADLSADLAGIAFARRLIAKPSLLASVEKSFTVADYALPPKGLPEGLTAAEFARRYGSIKDERFQHALADLRKRIDALPGYRNPSQEKPAAPR